MVKLLWRSARQIWLFVIKRVKSRVNAEICSLGLWLSCYSFVSTMNILTL